MLRLLVSPLYLLLPPLLLLLSLPLAIFAVFTTTLTVIILLFRVSLIYLNIGHVLIHHWLLTLSAPPQKPAQKTSPRSSSSPTTPGNGSTTPLTTRHARRSSKSSPSSVKSFRFDETITQRPSRSDSYASLLGAANPARDYEGIGGWRDSSAADEDARWTNLNSRLELPARSTRGTESPVRPRRHKRSLTGGSQWLRMSPVQSRARSPSGSREELGYFGQVHGEGRFGPGKQKATSVVSMDADYQGR